MKFFHAANIYLGAAAESGRPWTNDRKQVFTRDFLAMLDRINEEKADALFITGNLFADPVSLEALQALDNCFDLCRDTRVFWVLGMHDAAVDFSVFQNYTWKNRVTVFAGDKLERIYVPSMNAEITAMGYSSRTWKRVHPEELTPGSRGKMQFLLLPFLGDGIGKAEAEAFSSRFDYTALGQETGINGEAGNRVFSPGFFEPLGFSSQSRHGCIMGTMLEAEDGKTGLSVQFLPFASREYKVLRLEVTPDYTGEQLKAELEASLEENGRQNIYRIIVSGTADDSLARVQDDLKLAGNIEEVIWDCRAERKPESSTSIEIILEKLRQSAGKPLSDKALYYAEKALRHVKHQEE